MLDFTSNELFAKAILDDRRRDAAGTHRPPPTANPCSLRATLASWAAGIALAIDREVARRRIDGHTPAGRSA